MAPEDDPSRFERLERLADDPALRRRIRDCFPDVVAAGPLDRRTLLQLAAATLAIGGLSGCDDDRVVREAPLLSHPELPPGRAGGEAARIATTLDLDGYGLGVVATHRDGRAIRIDGNRRHPASLGAADVFAQAEILALHDPERWPAPGRPGSTGRRTAGERQLDAWRDTLRGTRGGGAAVLLPPSASPTLARLLAALAAALPEIRVHHWSPLAGDDAAKGAELAFGRAADLVFDLREADLVLSVGGDLFARGPGRLRHAADWAARRRDGSRPLPRLLAVETGPSLAGLRADERLALPPRAIGPFLRAVLADLAGERRADPHPAAARFADDLRRAGTGAVVAVGAEQPAETHALAHAIHRRLGSVAVRPIAPLRPGGGSASILALGEEIAAGRVRRLLILGGNPAYDAPADLGFAGLLARVPESLHLGLTPNETAGLCRARLPAAHPLESFGDSRAYDGTASFRQPAQHRLKPCWSAEEVLARLAGEAGEGRSALAETWRPLWAEGFDTRIEAALEAGVIEGSAAEPLQLTWRDSFDPLAGPTAARPAGGFELLLAPDPSVLDGRYADNGWLQELPKPVTKQVWGNAALLGPATARRLGVARGDRLLVESAGRRIEIPAWPLAGHAEGCLTVSLGYGRTVAGRVGSGIGIDAYRLRTSQDPWITGAAVTRAPGRATVISAQDRFSQEGQPILRLVPTRETELPVPAAQPSLYPAWPSGAPAWGMTIDLDSCIGCNACMVACQSENNVPVVGPEEAERGRLMHWLRVDRYEVESPDARSGFQPVPCMHCEAAPCEVVCPVNATVHSSEGLNDMVYSRCIGTRTCSNNCPYRVRRFNFTDPREGPYATPADALNPQVTIRGRGVMEKCTFCVQRISEGRIAARLEGRPIPDGEISTACEIACPTRAITFGDLSDPQSRVAASRQEGRHYPLLGELNTRPRTTYLARVEPGSGS